mgnify:FL=1
MSLSDIIRVPFGYLLEWLYLLTHNYGVALILFGVIVKLVLLPVSMKSKKSTMKMSRLSPQLKELEKKYGGDKAKYQQAVTRFYQEEGISPTGGCLWSFIPFFILIPLYQVIRQPLIYMLHLSSDTAASIVTALKDLGVTLGKSQYYEQLVAASKLPQYLDQVRSAVPALNGVDIPNINFSFLGLDLSAIPEVRFWTLTGWAAIGLFLIPLISGAINWLSMWIAQKQNGSVATDEKGEKGAAADAAMGSMKTMMLIMPFFSIYIGFTMPASISVYWITQGLLGIVQEWILTKHYRKIYDAEDLVRQQRAAERAAIEAERERIRAERRAKNPEGITDNTSKKKLRAREKAERGPAIEGKLTPEEREALRAQKAAATGGDPNRPYCRGRAYEPDRYGKDGEVLVDEAETEVVDDYVEPEEDVQVVDDYEEAEETGAADEPAVDPDGKTVPVLPAEEHEGETVAILPEEAPEDPETNE